MYVPPLANNNFKFVSEDVGRIIKWNDTTYGTDTILEVIKDEYTWSYSENQFL